MTAYVFVHSPLVGAITWQSVVDDLHRRGLAAIAPSLFENPNPLIPYWQQHAQSVAQAVERELPNEPIILVGHSGGGMLLPAIRQSMGRPVHGYLFVDADLPKNGFSRFDLFDTPESIAEFREAAVDGLLTPWTSDDLRDSIPNVATREKFVADMRPMPLHVYEEPIPVFESWPDAPCAYLQFSPTYAAPAQQAGHLGWPYVHLKGGHFHMLVEPNQVTETIVVLSYAIRD